MFLRFLYYFFAFSCFAHTLLLYAVVHGLNDITSMQKQFLMVFDFFSFSMYFRFFSASFLMGVITQLTLMIQKKHSTSITSIKARKILWNMCSSPIRLVLLFEFFFWIFLSCISNDFVFAAIEYDHSKGYLKLMLLIIIINAIRYRKLFILLCVIAQSFS